MKNGNWKAVDLAVPLMVGGCALIAFALAAEWFVAGSAPGLGRKQLMLLGGGALLALLGAWLRESTRNRMRGLFAVQPDDVVLGLPQILTLAAVIGAACALAEAALLAFMRFGLHRIIRVGPDVIWMSAVIDIVVLAAFGATLRAIGVLLPRVRTARVVTFVLALVAVDAVLHRIPAAARASGWSKWILAAGLALVITRLAESRRMRGGRTRRRLAVGVVASVVVLTAAALSVADAREAIARARLPAAAGDRPNILLIILDTVRAANLSLYGYGRPTTPNLERLAASSAVFDRAIAPSSWTLPSHASIFTGRDPNELSADWWIPLDDTHPTLAEVLTEAGYATTAFSANIAYANRETGLARGFARFDDYTRTTGEAIRTSVMLRRTLRRFGGGALINDDLDGRRTADHVNGTFLHWLDRAPADRPFFAFLNYMDGHDPYHAAAPFDSLYPPVEPHAPLTWGKPPSAGLMENWTNGYDRALTYLDDRLEQLFDSLASRGALDNTIVVVTADHGEHLGEFGYMRHGNTLYMPVLHVPLLIRYPASVPGSVRVGTTVGVRDIAATVLELARIDGGALGGESLTGGWQGDTLDAREIYARVGEAIRVPARYPNADTDLHSLIAGGFQYIRTVDGPEELLRLTEDDAAPIDLTRAPQSGPTLERMRRDLDRRLGTSPVTRATARGPESR